MTNFNYTAESKDEGLSLKEVLRTHFGVSSRFLSKIKYQNLAKVNGNVAPLWFELREGDFISISKPNEKSTFIPEDIPIHPIFEDDNILVLNKQAGVIVHPTKGHPAHTIANGLMKYMLDTDQSFKIRFVNRLDMDTSGLLVAAKDSYSQSQLTKQMHNGKMSKEYQAVVKGIIIDDEGVIDLPIGRPDKESVARKVLSIEEGGYPSKTKYTVLRRFPVSKTDNKKGYTLVNLKLATGRTHQIRVHMSHIGHPVLGDYLYGGDSPVFIDRQALHASKLVFNHPVTNKKMVLTSPLPDDINSAISKIEKKCIEIKD